MNSRGPITLPLVAVALVAALALLATPSVPAAETMEDGRVKGYVPPPKTLKKLGEGHWTPYDPPVPPEDARVHTVVRGDTLWDLALDYYDDHYLWPVIWDANRWVTYAHWIYPGDPLVIPPNPTVVPPEPPPPPAVVPPPLADTADAGEERPPVEPAGPVLRPLADTSELLCSGLLETEYSPSDFRIIGKEEPLKVSLADGDVVYMNGGLAAGVQPGALYSVVRPGARVEHPDSRRPFGVMMESLGRLRVIAVQAETATAEIVFACDSIMAGDDLVAFEEIPVPMGLPAAFDRWGSPNEPVGPTGWVLYARDGLTALGEGHLVAVDLGEGRGAKPGDMVSFYRERRGGLPRTMLGTGVVLRSSTAASTVKITRSVKEILIGDRVEMQ